MTIKQILRKENVKDYIVDKGYDRGPYVNILFRSKNPIKNLELFKKNFFGHKTHGRPLKKATIITCEGRNGWNDYLLLYHFDSKVRISPMTNAKSQLNS